LKVYNILAIPSQFYGCGIWAPKRRDAQQDKVH